MKHVFFIPGVLGVELIQAGKTIWPPSLCGVYSDAEVQKLLDRAVVPGKVIEHIAAVKPSLRWQSDQRTTRR